MGRLFFGWIVLLFAVSMGCQKQPTSSQTDLLQKVKDRGRLIVGVKGDYPPWGVINAQNQFEGCEIDIAKKIAEKLVGDANKIEFVAVTGGNRIPFLNSGKIDLIIATMGYTPERAKIVDYSAPYFHSGVQLLVKKDAAIKGLEDLKNQTVITVKGSTGSQGLAKLVPSAKQVKFDKTSEALQALADGRGVAFAQDDILLFKIVRDRPEFKVVGEVFNPTPWGIGIPKGQASMKKFVDETITELYQSGFIKQTFSRWWQGQEMSEYLRRLEKIFQK